MNTNQIKFWDNINSQFCSPIIDMANQPSGIRSKTILDMAEQVSVHTNGHSFFHIRHHVFHKVFSQTDYVSSEIQDKIREVVANER